MYTHMHTHSDVHTCTTYIGRHTYTHTCIYIHLHTETHMHTQMRTHTGICTHTGCTHLQTCTHPHTAIHTHCQSFNFHYLGLGRHQIILGLCNGYHLGGNWHVSGLASGILYPFTNLYPFLLPLFFLLLCSLPFVLLFFPLLQPYVTSFSGKTSIPS